MFKKVKENKKGFTLAELLIVVAIIAVLVAISIPIFTSQLERARDAASVANLRSAYAEATAQVLTSSTEAKTAIITGVKIESSDNNLGEGASELPFVVPTDITGKGSYDVTFTWNTDNKVSATAVKK